MEIYTIVTITSLLVFFLTFTAQARPVRVIILDFADKTGGSADAALTGNLNSKTFAPRAPTFHNNPYLVRPDFSTKGRLYLYTLCFSDIDHMQGYHLL